jgi:prepilin-type N-terminal cleavage/methylation domain-containing protein/prepilin-type processing-associated H-X9-DG protein
MRAVPSLCRGFTLVELLVVIGIIALLVSILLPALNKARRAAMDMQCLSNLRQVAQASLIYAHDWKGVLPTNGGSGAPGDRSHFWISSTPWYQKLSLFETYGTGFGGGKPYGSNERPPDTLTAYMCPLARSFFTDRGTGQRYILDYSLNNRLGGEGIGNRSPRVPKLQHLNAKRWWFGDGYFYFNASSNYRYYAAGSMTSEDYVGTRFQGPWMWAGVDGIAWSDGLPSHGNASTINSRAANFVFGDGHASPVTIAEVRAMRATKASGKSQVLYEWSGNLELRP